MQCICRNCSFELVAGEIEGRCPKCNSTRLINHPELNSLCIAHIDCDAFYASIEKRDNPKLKNKPVIVGGNKRGVVAACCYIARINGVHSAMPIYKAVKLCPEAEIITPDVKKYAKVGKQIKKLMRQTTPLVESLSHRSPNRVGLQSSRSPSLTEAPMVSSPRQVTMPLSLRRSMSLSIR